MELYLGMNTIGFTEASIQSGWSPEKSVWDDV